MSRHGFAGPVAMLYRTDGPNEVVRIEGDYRPRQIDSADVVAADATDPRGGPLILLFNRSCPTASSSPVLLGHIRGVGLRCLKLPAADLKAEELPSYHRNIDMDEVMLAHADDDPQGRHLGGFAFTPQGVLHGANEAFRAEFQARRTPGMRRTRTGIGVDTYRPLNVSPEFARMTG